MVTAVVVGGGSSSRMNGTDKLTLDLDGMTVFERSLRAFCLHGDVDSVVAVARKDLLPVLEPLKRKYPKLAGIAAGGPTRCLSVKAGLALCPEGTEYVAIHDAARPFVSGELIGRVIGAAKREGAAAPVLPVTDALKKLDGDGNICGTLDRNAVAAVQTPQVFRFREYLEASAGAEDSFDDCQLYEAAGRTVAAVEGERSNRKITVPEDEELLHERKIPDVRVGHGYDVHRFAEGRKLILGGEEIPYALGLLGHSDADVLLHAVADAVLGAAGLRDIGVHFPDTDPAWEGADSRLLLRECVRMAAERGFSVNNADATVVCQRPKLAGHIPAMIENIAADLGVSPDRVNVKATTEEGLGFTGEGLGVSAHAVVTLVR